MVVWGVMGGVVLGVAVGVTVRVVRVREAVIVVVGAVTARRRRRRRRAFRARPYIECRYRRAPDRDIVHFGLTVHVAQYFAP